MREEKNEGKGLCWVKVITWHVGLLTRVQILMCPVITYTNHTKKWVTETMFRQNIQDILDSWDIFFAMSGINTGLLWITMVHHWCMIFFFFGGVKMITTTLFFFLLNNYYTFYFCLLKKLICQFLNINKF